MPKIVYFLIVCNWSKRKYVKQYKYRDNYYLNSNPKSSVITSRKESNGKIDAEAEIEYR